MPCFPTSLQWGLLCFCPSSQCQRFFPGWYTFHVSRDSYRYSTACWCISFLHTYYLCLPLSQKYDIMVHNLICSLILWCSQIETRRRLTYSYPTQSGDWSLFASWIPGKMVLNHCCPLSIHPFLGWSRVAVPQFTSVFSLLFSLV